MQLKNEEAFFVVNQIEEIKKIKGLPYLDFTFKLIDIKKILMQEIKATNEKNETARKDIQSLRVKYCKKEKDGVKPLIDYFTTKDGQKVSNYVGLERGLNPEYDSKYDEMNTSLNAINNEIHDYIELDKIKISKKTLEISAIKENFIGDMYEAIQGFLE